MDENQFNTSGDIDQPIDNNAEQPTNNTNNKDDITKKNYLKSKTNIKNGLFLVLCLVLVHYGLYYGILTNVRVMIIAGVFIVARSIYLTRIPFD